MQVLLFLLYKSYPSGRTAITTCRKGDGSRGLYAFVYSDEADPKMLAWFTPYGKMACYHNNGSLWLLADADGGILLDEVCIVISQDGMYVYIYNV